MVRATNIVVSCPFGDFLEMLMIRLLCLNFARGVLSAQLGSCRVNSFPGLVLPRSF